MTPPIDWPQFRAACLLVDPHMTFEWGTKYLYLVPAEVTRDKWESYVEVCTAYKVPYQHATPPYRFFVMAFYRDDRITDPPIFGNMPFLSNAQRPRMSAKFRRLHVCVDNLLEYHELARRYDQGKTMQVRRLNELANDPFVVKWR